MFVIFSYFLFVRLFAERTLLTPLSGLSPFVFLAPHLTASAAFVVLIMNSLLTRPFVNQKGGRLGFWETQKEMRNPRGGTPNKDRNINVVWYYVIRDHFIHKHVWIYTYAKSFKIFESGILLDPFNDLLCSVHWTCSKLIWKRKNVPQLPTLCLENQKIKKKENMNKYTATKQKLLKASQQKSTFGAG